MGNYKDEHGTTRIGDFLRKAKDVAPVILETAGTITGVKQLKNLGKMIQGDTGMSAEDKETAMKLLELDIIEAQEITKRWQSDMQSDSWMSKNVRPMCLIALTVFFFFIAFTDSKTTWNFEVSPMYVELLKVLMVAVYLAYFGSRGYEKAMKIKNGK